MKAKLKTLFLISLSAVLSGCEPETPGQQAQAPAAVTPPAATVPASAPAVAAAPATAMSRELQLAQTHKCLACHAVDKRLVGPAWKDVAAKYRGQKGAEAKLIEKVAKGGSGVWGTVPMPPNSPQVSQDDIRALVRFILRMK